MAVRDHGLEVLKKAGNEIKSGDRSDYYLSTREVPAKKRGLLIETTSVTTTPTLIELPEGSNDITIHHESVSGVVYYGGDDSITTSSPSMQGRDSLELDLEFDGEIYMMASTGTITVFAMGTVREL